jgi:hypothetical protein
MKIHVPEVCTPPDFRKEGLLEIWTENSRLDENHVPQVDASSLEMDRELECMKNP